MDIWAIIGSEGKALGVFTNKTDLLLGLSKVASEDRKHWTIRKFTDKLLNLGVMAGTADQFIIANS